MNPNQNQLEKALGLLEQYSSGVICLAQNPSEDAIASAVGLYMGLTKAGKNISIVCATPVKSQLPGAEKIGSDFATAGDSLVISFPYEDGAIDKVDYYIQNDRFNIVVTPRPGREKLNEKTVQYSMTGGLVEFVITVDTTSLKQLGATFEKHQEQIKGKPLINIDRHLTNTFFGQANLVNRNSSSNAELVMQILTGLKIELDRDIANALLAGIIASTANYSAPHTNAQTFEASAQLMKHGAGKPKMAPGQPMRQQPMQQAAPNQFAPQPSYGAQPQQFMPPRQPQQMGGFPPTQSQQAPMPQQPNPFMQQPPQGQFSPPAQQSQPPQSIDTYFDDDDEEEEDDDWLKPSIFTPKDTPAQGGSGSGNPNSRG